MRKINLDNVREYDAFVPAKKKKPKKHFYIILNGRQVGESWAVSAEKARTNYWWKNVKYGDEFSPRDYEPDDFDVIEA